MYAPETPYPHRWTLISVAGAVALAGAEGTWQLIAGIATPPDTDLPPGLSSWVLPGIWLWATVALPWGMAAWLSWTRSATAPFAVLLACVTLIVELLVQLPFLGFSVLQLVFAGVALVTALLAADARRQGWRAGPPPLERPR